MYTKGMYIKCIPNFDKLLYTFCIQNLAVIVALILYTKCIQKIVVLILYTKCIQKFVERWYTFCIHQLHTSCTIFVYKMYTRFPCGLCCWKCVRQMTVFIYFDILAGRLRSNSCLKILKTSSLTFSACGPHTFSKQAKPSSLNKPTLSFSYYVEVWITFSFYPCRCIMRFTRMHYGFYFFFADSNKWLSVIYCFHEKTFGNWRVKFFDVKLHENADAFIIDIFK